MWIAKLDEDPWDLAPDGKRVLVVEALQVTLRSLTGMPRLPTPNCAMGSPFAAVH